MNDPTEKDATAYVKEIAGALARDAEGAKVVSVTRSGDVVDVLLVGQRYVVRVRFERETIPSVAKARPRHLRLVE